MTERRAHRKADTRERLAFAFGFALILVGFWVLHVQQRHLSSQARLLVRQERELRADAVTLSDQHEGLVNTCIRLQIVRIEDNLSHYADYRVFSVVLRLSRLAMGQRHLSSARRRHELQLLPSLAAAVRSKAWVPVADCTRTVNLHGARFRPPRPVPFYKRLPPLSALSLPEAYFR